MKLSAAKNDVIKQLQKDILSLQGYSAPSDDQCIDTGLGMIERAFPKQTFPTGAVHEFISPEPRHAAATSGFIAGLLSRLMLHKGVCLWIGTKRTIFPPALKLFGIAPERIVFED